MNDNSTVDTNILIYSFGAQDDLKKRIAKQILAECNKISLQAINETLFVLYRKFDFPIKDLNTIIRFFKENFLIKNTDIFTLEKAFAIMEKYNYSYWDSMMLASAIESDCPVIFSEDMQHGQTIEGKLKIVNPFISHDFT